MKQEVRWLAKQVCGTHCAVLLSLGVQNLQKAPLSCKEQQGRPCVDVHRPLACIKFLALLQKDRSCRHQLGRHQNEIR